MRRIVNAVSVLLLLPALLWLWWQWSKYEGWITRYEMRVRCGGGMETEKDMWLD